MHTHNCTQAKTHTSLHASKLMHRTHARTHTHTHSLTHSHINVPKGVMVLAASRMMCSANVTMTSAWLGRG